MDGSDEGEIEQRLGILAIDIYGLSEIMGPGVASECEYQQGLHIAEDFFLAEIIDPETLEPLPYGRRANWSSRRLTRTASR